MIKIHNGVAINPVNVVSIKEHYDDATVTVFLWNNRVHNVRCRDRTEMLATYADIYMALANEIDMVRIDNENAVNVDAIVSIAKVEDGIAINLVSGSRIKIEGSDIDALFTDINNRICNEAA